VVNIGTLIEHQPLLVLLWLIIILKL